LLAVTVEQGLVAMLGEAAGASAAGVDGRRVTVGLPPACR
jgi:hypothetical protein